MFSSLKGCIRLALGSVYAAALAVASRPYKIGPGGVLVVAPHPDDETLGCGGLLAAKARAGQDAQVIFITDGSASHPAHPRLNPAALTRQRREEALSALAILGLAAERAHFLNRTDGTLDALSDDQAKAVTQNISDLIRKFRPAEIFTTWRHDGSTEHAAACRLTVEALADAGGGRLFEYPVWAWWNPLRLTRRFRRGGENYQFSLGPLARLKRQALNCHRSQVDSTPPWNEPVLPAAISRSSCGGREFYFATRVAGR